MHNPDRLITLDRLHSLVSYNPDTGKLTWLSARGRMPIGSEAGSMNQKGYFRIQIDGVEYSLHRLVWFYHYGKWPLFAIDHRDRDPRNNRVSNLRDVSLPENQWNREEGLNQLELKATGVCLEKRTGKYYAKINVRGRQHNLGTFNSFEEARLARQAAKISFHTIGSNHDC